MSNRGWEYLQKRKKDAQEHQDTRPRSKEKRLQLRLTCNDSQMQLAQRLSA